MNRENEVRVVSVVQAKAYIKNGLQPLRVEADDILVFVFDKEASKPLFEAWKNRTIKF
nr:MAG TPA: hypothetical protein [Caudoviricetes sp.]